MKDTKQPPQQQTEKQPREKQLIGKSPKGGLVQDAAEQLRELILAREPGAQIGSLNEVAELLGVGIVTVQQAARILEHEGLLSVKRGPGGGYYGARPDAAALVRGFASYMRVHGYTYRDTVQMNSLLDFEIMPAAALCDDENLRDQLRLLIEQIDLCDTAEQRANFELTFHSTARAMAAQPLVELISKVISQMFTTPDRPLFASADDVLLWKRGRRRMLQAIIERDPTLARFEAERFRELLMARLPQ